MSDIPRRVFGEYYTPYEVARRITVCALEKNPRTILEPSCGDGVFLRCLRELGYDGRVVAVELNKDAAIAARSYGWEVYQADFLSFDLKGESFDCVLGNPPYLHYNYIEDIDRVKKVLDQYRVAYYDLLPYKNRLRSGTGLMNLWTAFVARCLLHLNPGGFLSMVLPSRVADEDHRGWVDPVLGYEDVEEMPSDSFSAVVRTVILSGHKNMQGGQEKQVNSVQLRDIVDHYSGAKTGMNAYFLLDEPRSFTKTCALRVSSLSTGEVIPDKYIALFPDVPMDQLSEEAREYLAPFSEDGVAAFRDRQHWWHFPTSAPEVIYCRNHTNYLHIAVNTCGAIMVTNAAGFSIRPSSMFHTAPTPRGLVFSMGHPMFYEKVRQASSWNEGSGTVGWHRLKERSIRLYEPGDREWEIYRETRAKGEHMKWVERCMG